MPSTCRIQTEEDVAAWRSSPGYTAFVEWVVKRSRRIVGKEILEGQPSNSERIRKLVEVLDVMEQWIEEVPLLPESQRFGNKAFRSYIDLVEQRLPTLLPTPQPLTDHILPLLISSHAFGHPIRLDYGSGHELSFVLSLWEMVQMGWIGVGRERKEAGEMNGDGTGESQDGKVAEMNGEEEEDELVLIVFPRYLTLVTHLQKKYRLEPAGSHGVWGLDDYCFLPYVFGSAEMLGMEVTPEAALRNAKAYLTRTDGEQPKDLWTLSLKRVFEFKSGPFFEHSPLLNSLSTTMPSFTKIHSGLVKMFQAEVLGKRVVVQHLFLDEITWGGDNMPSGEAEGLAGIGGEQSDSDLAQGRGQGQVADGKQRGVAGQGGGELKVGMERIAQGGEQGTTVKAPWAMPTARSAAAGGRPEGAGAGAGYDGATRAPWAR